MSLKFWHWVATAVDPLYGKPFTWWLIKRVHQRYCMALDREYGL